jgi:hypothetical protein
MLVSGGWQYKINDKLSADINAAFTHYSSVLGRKTTETTGIKNTPGYDYLFIENTTENGINDYSIKASFNYNPKYSHNFFFGANYVHHRFMPEFTKAISNTNSGGNGTSNANNIFSANEVNLFIEDNWNIFKALNVNGGLRFTLFDVHGKTYSSLEPRISARLLLSPCLSMKASYSRMSQYAQQVSDSYISLPTDFWMPVSKNQKPLVSDQVSSGFYYNLNNKYSFSVEGYYKWMNNLLDYKDGYNFLPSTISWENKLASGKGWSYGADFMASKETGNITGYVSYGLMWANRQFPQINNGIKFPSKYDNRHKINIVANWKLNKNIELNGSWTYMTGNRVTLALENYQGIRETGFLSDKFPSIYYFQEAGLSYYDKKNNIRLPSYHSLDVGINIYRPKKNGRMGIWNISVYNAYSRMNPIVVSKESLYVYSDNVNYKLTNKFRTLSLLPIMPSISYTYKF